MEAKIWNMNKWIKETDPRKLSEKYRKMLLDSGFKVLDVTEHFFDPIGYTCLFLLGESHFAIHTFPEFGKTYIELSSCNGRMFERFNELLSVDTPTARA